MKSLQSPISELRLGISELRRPGETGISGSALAVLLRVVVTATIATTNLLGAGAVLVIALFVVPEPALGARTGHIQLVNGLVAAGYVLAAIPLGTVLGLRVQQPWLRDERPATLAEARTLLQAPLRLFGLQVALWLVAAVLFGVLDATYDTTLGLRAGIIVAITGFVTAALAYLLADLVLRPAAARALSDRAPGPLVVPGVATRAFLAWLFGTGLPVVGIVAIGVLALTGDRSSTRTQLGVAMVALGGVGLSVGLLAVLVAARATADPVESVRRALARVQRGELDVRVPVYDGTQIGQLQLGFNEMAAGLAERERIREAFGTYVDPDVAERILHEGTDLAGEQVEVTVMFIDIRDFTGFAERTSAEQVVAAINECFGQFVAVIHAHQGRVDKFVGDGLLAVFGAPRRLSDHADRALAAAIEIVARVHSSYGLSFGIGLNSGEVVAGNVGGAGRLEFSVIGDPVNVAARVEAATRQTGDPILLAEHTRELLRAPHPPLVEREGIALKGKTEAIRLYAPQLTVPADAGS
ncbi:MAG TPA: adenylate/guanylate cyclase domain-containing protein, partial [Solirubrobacteraceae bacterium]|nr:adenylate/guanylate cyclase domain-containing protein [Solirubrobacteraceae bacterium]